MFNPDNQMAVDYNAMPAAVFFSPQVGQCRYHGARGLQNWHTLRSCHLRYTDTAYGVSLLDLAGFVKVLADSDSR